MSVISVDCCCSSRNPLHYLHSDLWQENVHVAPSVGHSNRSAWAWHRAEVAYLARPCLVAFDLDTCMWQAAMVSAMRQLLPPDDNRYQLPTVVPHVATGQPQLPHRARRSNRAWHRHKAAEKPHSCQLPQAAPIQQQFDASTWFCDSDTKSSPGNHSTPTYWPTPCDPEHSDTFASQRISQESAVDDL